MIPLKILLTYYHSTRARLACATLPYGISMTKFVNDAICEKLDREQPETIGVKAVVPGEHEPEAVPSWEDVKKAAIPKDEEGAYCLKYKGTLMYNVCLREHKKLGRDSPGMETLLEVMFTKSGEPLSDEEKSSIMEKHKAEKAAAVEKTMENVPDGEIPDSVKGHPRKYAEWRAKQDAAKQAVDADFWGEEDDFSKVRALVKRHTR